MGRQGVEEPLRDPLARKWLKKNNLVRLEGWARDGYSMGDMARKMCITVAQLKRLAKENFAIYNAISRGKETVDYEVEKALLKSALGYTHKEVKVTSIIRHGRTIETQKEVLTTDVAPSVPAAQFWLTNRLPDKWKKDPQKGILDEVDEDTSIKIEVKRASKPDGDESDTWGSDVNSEVVLRKATAEEKAEADEKLEKHNEYVRKQFDELEREVDEINSEWDELIASEWDEGSEDGQDD